LAQYTDIKAKIESNQLDRDFVEIQVAAQNIQTKKVIGRKPDKDIYAYNDKTRAMAKQVEDKIDEYRAAVKKDGLKNLNAHLIDAGRVAVREAPTGMEGATLVLKTASAMAGNNRDELKRILPRVAESMGYQPARFEEWLPRTNQQIKSSGITKQIDEYNSWQRQFSGRNLTHKEYASLPGKRGATTGEWLGWIEKQ
jgi:hypothetical protein